MHREHLIDNLNLLVVDSYEKMSEYAAGFVLSEIKTNPNLLICTATGSTPTLTYDLVAKEYEKAPEIFSHIRIIKLDEWGGVSMDDPATCEVYLREHLIQPLHIDESRFISFKSNPDESKQEVERIQKELENKGPIDLCILGMGVNGHLGFNEPVEKLQAHAHVAQLADSTKDHTMAQKTKGNIVYGLTLGIEDILASKKILLLVNGEHKREPFDTFLSQEVTPEFPVSMLWKHSDVTVMCDEGAHSVR